MIVAVLVIVGLCLGSFANALVWRVHEQARQGHKKKSDKKYAEALSIAHGRSMCPDCKHQLAAKDLIPVLSWLSLGGKCRYCHKPIPAQYPLVELTTASLFVASYLWWPLPLAGSQIAAFVLWLVLLTGFMALLVYDLRWKLLPDRLTYPLGLIAAAQAVILINAASKPLVAFIDVVLAVAVGGGIFYVLFQVSKGKWIGGGDVKLGWLLGLVVATPARGLLLVFLASVLGSLMTAPLLAVKRLKRTSTIPFGPFLIMAAIVVQLFGADILSWYQHAFLTF